MPYSASIPTCMNHKGEGYVNVDELMPQITVDQAAQFYGVVLSELQQVGKEIRTRCFLNCGRAEETGDRALAIRADSPAKQWKCHQYDCGKGGNLVSMCDLMKPGTHSDGRPRGERFKAIRDDLKAMVSGLLAADTPVVVSAKREPAAEPPKTNPPLAQSDNERARTLVNLDEKFLVEPDETMNKFAAAYLRRRSYLTPGVCRQWRMGYLPHDVGGQDKSGGTMRGKVVYGLANEAGEIVTWFGRDPEFEPKHAKWEATDRSGREPQKFHFVKGFHRGLELYGQHVLHHADAAEQLQRVGLLIVEGPNDVIRLATLGAPAVAILSNHITSEQAERAGKLADQHAGGVMTLMLDLDAEGQNGVGQALAELAQYGRVQLAWSARMHGGEFRGRQPESLTPVEWDKIASVL